MEEAVCPECQQGKHVNCTKFAYDEIDRLVGCRCPTCKNTREHG